MTWELAGYITAHPLLSQIVGILIASLAIGCVGCCLFIGYMFSGIGPGCPGGFQMRWSDRLTEAQQRQVFDAVVRGR